MEDLPTKIYPRARRKINPHRSTQDLPRKAKKSPLSLVDRILVDLTFVTISLVDLSLVDLILVDLS
jgi:hypothetical protein